MCWICGCADHIGLGNDDRVSDKNVNQLNDIIDDEQSSRPA